MFARIPIFLVLSVALATTLSAQEPANGAAAESVNNALEAYHGKDQSANRERKLRFVYFTPKNREPAPQYRERLTRLMEETVAFYAQEFKRWGIKARPLPLNRNEDGLVNFHVVKGGDVHTAYKKEGGNHLLTREYEPVLRAAGIDPNVETIAVFSNLAEWDDESKYYINNNGPYNGSGGPKRGTCFQIDVPVLDPAKIPEAAPIVTTALWGKISLGEWNSRLVGGVMHELGHALGLPHESAKPSDWKQFGSSLMGRGNLTFGRERRGEGLGTYLTFTSVLRLASHPFFTGSEKGLEGNGATQGSIREVRIKDAGRKIKLSGVIKSQIPAYAVVAYTDPEPFGLNKDYDASTANAIPDSEGRFNILCDTLSPGRSQLKILALLVNGQTIGGIAGTFTVQDDGTLDLTGLRAR